MNRNEIRGGDMEGGGSCIPGRPDKILLFFSYEKERKLCTKRKIKRRRERGGEGG